MQINGVRDRLRVLLVSGEPNQGERTWRRLLKSDPAVDLVHFTILRPPEKDDTTPLNELALIAFPDARAVPGQARGLRPDHPRPLHRTAASCRICICATSPTTCATAARLLLSVGPEFTGARSLDQTPLGAVLPAHAPADGRRQAAAWRRARFVPRVTDLGHRHPVTEGLPGPDGRHPDWGAWYRAIDARGRAGQVLMTGPDGPPLLILSHVDQGRVAHAAVATRSGCGRAATRAAARRPSCCAASRTG